MDMGNRPAGAPPAHPSHPEASLPVLWRPRILLGGRLTRARGQDREFFGQRGDAVMEGTPAARIASTDAVPTDDAPADYALADLPDAEGSAVGVTAPAATAEPSRDAPTLEHALVQVERATETALDATAQLTRTLRRLRAAAQGGNLRDLRTSLTAVTQAADRARERARDAAASWTFDEGTYFESGDFTRELLAAARDDGLQMFERDERLYCYPVLVRVAPPDRAVFIDRARERRVRPSVLVRHLRAVQGRPPRFRPEAFLEALFTAYGHLARRRGGDDAVTDHPERLDQVYELLTLMPGAAREYSRQEFARDVYLLDRSGLTMTRRGYVVSFPASTGARSAASALRVVTEGGQEKVYYSIAFTRAG